MPQNWNQDDYFEFSSGKMNTETATNISMAFMQLVVVFFQLQYEMKTGNSHWKLLQVIFTYVSNTHTQKD